MKTVAIIFACLAMTVCASAVNPALPNIPANVFYVTDYGAVGDGASDNTVSIQNTINAANAAGGGIVDIPAGTYLSGPITLLSSINLHIETNGMLQMLPLGTYPGGATNAFTFIYCNVAHDVEISGQGRIDGQGQAWWTYNATNNTIVRPMMLELFSVNRLFIHDITYQNPPYHHCGIRSNGGNITISNLTVNTPSPSPNTDGLNFVGTNSIIENCHITDGDDDIAMGSTGPLSDLLITNCVFGTGHGVSIGSGISVGISNVTVVNCTFNGTDYGIRMKADTNSGALVQDLHYLNLTMTNMNNGAITIYSYYNEIGTPVNITPAIAAGETISPINSATPTWRNITFSNLTASVRGSGVAGIIWGRTEFPVTNVVMNHVKITAPKTFDVYNAQGIQFLDSTLSTGTGKTLTIWNAYVTVSNSAPVTNLFTFAGLGGDTNDSLSFFNASASLTSTDLFGANPLTLSGCVLTNIGNLAFPANEAMNFALGTNNSIVVISGNLALNGILNVTNAAGFTATNYTLFTYTGTLSGQPILGSMPPGYSGVLNTSTAGLVKLTTSYTGVFTITTTNILQSSANPSTFGTPVTFAATVNPAPTNGETVIFEDGNTVLGTGTLTNGHATFTTSTNQLAVGNHSITAIYASDGAYGASTSLVLAQTVNPPLGTWFGDNFSTSTVDSATPLAPTPLSTSYEVLSGKPWNPTPAITSAGLLFGIGSTASGVIELQALFSSSPIALLATGDFVQLKVTFTDTAGILTQSGTWCFGLYDSGGVFPVAGGLNGGLASTSSTVATGGTQNWQGYVAQIGFTGSPSGFYDRKPQSTGTANNDQALLTMNTSSSYQNPAATLIGTASTTPSVTLTNGNQYTEILTYTLTSSNALQLQHQLYGGTDATGALLSTMTAFTGPTPLTNHFDGLAIGWRATGSTPSSMLVNSISVTGQSTKPLIQYACSNSLLTLTWPENYLGWLLQSNAGSLASSNWVTIPGSGNATNLPITINPAGTNAFYRLVSPY